MIKINLNIPNVRKQWFESSENSVLKSTGADSTLAFKNVYVDPAYAEDFKLLTVLRKTSEFLNLYFKNLNLKFNEYDIIFAKTNGSHNMGYLQPAEKRIVIEVRNPGHAVLHEIGHLVDHEYGEGLLSEQKEFNENIAEIYRQVFSETANRMKEPERDYYFSPNEIFARCFTYYFEAIKGFSILSSYNTNEILYEEFLESSGMQVSETAFEAPAYFSDLDIECEESLCYNIKNYFDGIFKLK